MIANQDRPQTKDMINDLLFLLVYRSPLQLDVEQSYLAKEFLDLGADPNIVVADHQFSLWKRLFSRICLLCIHSEFSTNGLPFLVPAHIDAFLPTIVAFIQNGADVSGIFSLQVFFKFCIFNIKASVLTLLEICFYDHHEFPHLRDLCIAKGSHNHLRCPSLNFDSRKRSRRIQACFIDVEYELSAQEEDELLQIWKQHREGTLGSNIDEQIPSFICKSQEERGCYPEIDVSKSCFHDD